MPEADPTKRYQALTHFAALEALELWRIVSHDASLHFDVQSI